MMARILAQFNRQAFININGSLICDEVDLGTENLVPVIDLVLEAL